MPPTPVLFVVETEGWFAGATPSNKATSAPDPVAAKGVMAGDQFDAVRTFVLVPPSQVYVAANVGSGVAANRQSAASENAVEREERKDFMFEEDSGGSVLGEKRNRECYP